MSDSIPSEERTKSASDFAKQFKETMRCNCNLDNWQPDNRTGHSWVCRIHRTAIGHYNAQFNGGRVVIAGVRGYD